MKAIFFSMAPLALAVENTVVGDRRERTKTLPTSPRHFPSFFTSAISFLGELIRPLSGLHHCQRPVQQDPKEDTGEQATDDLQNPFDELASILNQELNKASQVEVYAETDFASMISPTFVPRDNCVTRH